MDSDVAQMTSDFIRYACAKEYEPDLGDTIPMLEANALKVDILAISKTDIVYYQVH